MAYGLLLGHGTLEPIGRLDYLRTLRTRTGSGSREAMSAFGVGRAVWNRVRVFPVQAFSALILAFTKAVMEIMEK